MKVIDTTTFSKTSKDSYAIRFKNGVTVCLTIPQENEKMSLIEQVQNLFCSSAMWLRVFAAYFDGKRTIDITEQLGMKGDYTVASAEELADFLYGAKSYIAKTY